ncbi:MAG: VanZ family protein [Anaeroplasmataceae bacterium]|nr:VanZ family protein [Anaeroplasmataceae bacterium]
MKNIIKKSILILISLFWMGVIFYFSSQNGTTSSGMSNRITQFIVRIFIPHFSDLKDQEQTRILTNISYIVRKLAHYSEYAILGLFLFLAVSSFTKKQNYVFLISGFIGILYAITDEFHQSFVSDRTPMVKDVVIDSIGLITMIVFLGIIWNIKRMKKKRIEV